MTDSRPEDREVYDARIDENEILTPAAPDAPRINGPKVYGARPRRKNLADNSKALAIFNRDPKSESVIDVTLT